MPQSDTISILCVDDEPLFLDSFQELLEQEGFAVTAATTVDEAIELLNTHYFDVITSDYAMPGMDGLSLLQEIRSRGCNSLFVVITAKRLAHIAIDALNSGADYYVQKGTDIGPETRKLAAFIRQRISGGNTGREIEEWEKFFRSVIESQNEVICRLAPDGAFTYANETGLRFFRKSYDAILGENFFAAIPDDDQPPVREALGALSPVRPDILIEHRIRNGEGKVVLLESNFHGFFGSGGVISQYQVGGRDTASLIQTDEPEYPPRSIPSVAPAAPAPAKDGSADWKGLVETIQTLDNPVFAIDKAGIIIAWNHALEQLTGVPAASMLGKGSREYAVPFYGKPAPMLIDHIVSPPEASAEKLPAIKRVGDTFIGDVEHVKIQGKPMLLWAKGSPVYDANGALIAAIEAITVGEPQAVPETEDYLGGISSITLKLSGEGMGGAIAGAIGSTTGGFGVYATSKRLFVIRNPDLSPESAQGVGFGALMMDELFGTTVDSRQKPVAELEKLQVFTAAKDDVESIELKKPVLLSGYMTVIKKDKSSFRVYIDHKKAFTHIEQLMKSFLPERLRSD